MEAAHRIRAWRSRRDEEAAAGRAGRPGGGGARGPQHHAGLDRRARAGVTTGEWGEACAGVFGEYRAPTGVTPETVTAGATEDIRLMVADLGQRLGATPRLVVGKPGLDGHSNGAEQIALRGPRRRHGGDL